jgi:hypothetical protein
MGFNPALGGGDGDAGEDKASSDLILIEKRLILLIHTAADQLASAGGTGAGPAGDWQIDVVICRSIVDRLIIAAVNGAVDPFLGVDERDFVGAMESV